MSEANLATIAKIAEVTLGTTPGSPELTTITFSGETLKNSIETVVSQAIRSDRQIDDLVKVGSSPDGGYDFELNYGDYDEELRGALGAAAWNNHSQALGDVAFDSSAQTLVNTGGEYSDVVAGALLTIANAEDSGNNGDKRVVSVSSDGNTVTFAAGSIISTNANDTTADTAQVAIVNGILKPGMTIEKGVTNTAGTKFFQIYTGMVVDTLSLNIESRAILTGSVGFIGMGRALGTATIDTSGTYTAPISNPVMNGTSNIGSITVDGVTATEKFKSLSIDITNNLRGKDAMGTEGNFDIGTGTFNLTGTLSAYFLNNDFLTRIDANTSFALELTVTDNDSDAYNFFLPNCKPVNGDPAITAINTDVMIDTEYQAIRSAVYDITFAITKLPA